MIPTLCERKRTHDERYRAIPVHPMNGEPTPSPDVPAEAWEQAPCPQWCDYRHLHLDQWDIETSTGLPVRSHEANVAPVAAPVWAYVFAEERLRDGDRHLGQPMVAAGVDEYRDGELLAGLTAQEARAFASLLLAAADRAEQVAQAPDAA